MEEKKNLEVVSGDGSNLDISPAYDNFNDVKPTSADKKPTNIVIPKETTKISKNTKQTKNDNEYNESEKKEEN